MTNRVSLSSPLEPGSPIIYANDMDIASDGMVYFTTSVDVPLIRCVFLCHTNNRVGCVHVHVVSAVVPAHSHAVMCDKSRHGSGCAVCCAGTPLMTPRSRTCHPWRLVLASGTQSKAGAWACARCVCSLLYTNQPLAGRVGAGHRHQHSKPQTGLGAVAASQ